MKRPWDTGRLDPARMAVPLGTVSGHRQQVFLQHRDAMLVEGPTGSGKTWRLAYQLVSDAPGFVLVTTTKARDVLGATIADRARVGATAVFDPEGLTGWPAPIRWSILTGCDDPDTAIRRAAALARAMPMEGARNSGYFESKAATLLRCYLHAAALEHIGIREVRQWVSSRTTTTAHDILARHLPDWASELSQILTSASESSDDVIAAAARLLEPLASPRLLSAVDIDQDAGFDVASFVLDPDRRNTLYLVSKGTTGSMAPFVAALAAEVHHVADRASQLHRSGRLDPPVRLVLDEVNNVAPIPELPSIMSDSGGRGISVYAFAHNQRQNQARWGDHGGLMLAHSAPAMLILPGMRGDELNDLSRLIGNRREWRATIGRGAPSYQLHDDPIMTAAQLRELDTDDALLLYRNAGPIVLNLPTVWQVPHLRRRVLASLAEFDAIVQRGTVPRHYTGTTAVTIQEPLP
ncbi:type IV secretory system conjugative DNA transfer family protein [Nocardia sp. alder85J]|uniref:type IV secretory system conjugative DNA transfer family protein n=1 Tax=Nocardia sp. alder85J TaxID=2862949 RepID=UPI001CD7B743|nr:TraM recognition domain-containing protein [Nocardia sp. alder85J]MCX4097703.1 TraM recognition domain-containing protein [Nocardia sp. alder85J]